MKPILMIGTSIVNLALLSYTIFIILEIKHRKVSRRVLSFLTIGVILDLTATICMVVGSSKGIFTLHGVIGYSSLTAMSIDAILIWKLRSKSGLNIEIPKATHVYSVIAYSWWVIAYITGALLVFLFR
jgi:hypothetical protein